MYSMSFPHIGVLRPLQNPNLPLQLDLGMTEYHIAVDRFTCTVSKMLKAMSLSICWLVRHLYKSIARLNNEVVTSHGDLLANDSKAFLHLLQNLNVFCKHEHFT